MYGFGFACGCGVSVVECVNIDVLRKEVKSMVRRGFSWLWVWCDGDVWEFEGGKWRKVK